MKEGHKQFVFVVLTMTQEIFIIHITRPIDLSDIIHMSTDLAPVFFFSSLVKNYHYQQIFEDFEHWEMYYNFSSICSGEFNWWKCTDKREEFTLDCKRSPLFFFGFALLLTESAPDSNRRTWLWAKKENIWTFEHFNYLNIYRTFRLTLYPLLNISEQYCNGYDRNR